MHTTNSSNAFIAVSPDTKAVAGRVPDRPDSVAGIQHAMIAAAPGRWTSDDVIFETHARRAGIPAAERDAARAAFFAKGQACLRASPLVKTHGWGVFHDAEGRVTLIGLDDPRYAELAGRDDLEQTAGMRSARARA